MSEHRHEQRFDGDDPYLVCVCGARWDAITGKPLNALATPPVPAGQESPQSIRNRFRDELREALADEDEAFRSDVLELIGEDEPVATPPVPAGDERDRLTEALAEQYADDSHAPVASAEAFIEWLDGSSEDVRAAMGAYLAAGVRLTEGGNQ